jgi:hypothetical protein
MSMTRSPRTMIMRVCSMLSTPSSRPPFLESWIARSFVSAHEAWSPAFQDGTRGVHAEIQAFRHRGPGGMRNALSTRVERRARIAIVPSRIAQFSFRKLGRVSNSPSSFFPLFVPTRSFTLLTRIGYHAWGGVCGRWLQHAATRTHGQLT